MVNEIIVKTIEQELSASIVALQAEPEFQGTGEPEYAVNSSNVPQIKVAIGNVPLEYDLWEGLRNPAVVGIYPAGLSELWEFYANRRKQKVDEAGRQTIFQVPRSFDYARANYCRVVMISIMLPFSPVLVQDYLCQVLGNQKRSSHLFARMYEHLNRLLDKAVTRTAIGLVTDDSERVVVAMNSDTVKAVSTEVMPQTRQGISHGPSKGGNFPQKSIAVLLGLGQFGVSRMVIRDEIINGKVERFTGPIRSIIIFDKQKLITDGSGGVMYPSPEWRRFLFQLFDFTDNNSDINKYRFCSHIPMDDLGCNKCSDFCPSGAQGSSSPKSDGRYPEQVSRQAHRFWDGRLQFDFGKCTDERGQMSGLLAEWSCGRCPTVCADQGIRRKAAVQSFYGKMSELTQLAD
jgi:hypothetical protein